MSLDASKYGIDEGHKKPRITSLGATNLAACAVL